MEAFERTPDRAEIADTVRLLVRGFATLARAQAPAMQKGHAFSTLEIVQELLANVERFGWDETADLLRDADGPLNIRIAPPR